MTQELMQWGFGAFIAFYVIKELISLIRTLKTNGSSDDRRNADTKFKETIVNRLEAQTLLLTTMNDTTNSVNGKCARIEKDTNILVDRSSGDS